MAFRDIASTSAASTSSWKKSGYDVFINHRGTDTKHTVARSIYDMLQSREVRAFLDQDELQVGDSFPQAIEEAMLSASVHIAIFSPRYVESPWCLEELAFMFQINVAIIPVFFGVQPNDLRHVTKGMYAKAFGEHETKRDGVELRYNPQKINKWKDALSRVSYLNGCRLEGDKWRDQGMLLREIVEPAIDKIKKVALEVAKFPVGLDDAVKDFESKVGSFTGTGNVHVVGILGMGGSGKTTLAKELYNRNNSSFSRSSFLPNVRDAASTKTLHELQKKLLEHLRIQHPAFDHKDGGIGVLNTGLISMDVLIVLDDVDDMVQMEALLPDEMKHNLGQGSFIIVTTREEKVLKSSEISCIYNMKLLDDHNAKRLFCRHAFPMDRQPGFESINSEYPIDRFVRACNGLPLSLKVLGAMVKGESKAFWEDQLRKISRILPKEIANRLKLSYDALDHEDQQMFLDVACFFIGAEKSMVVAIWEGSRWSGEVGFQTLVNKCLIALDEDDRIEMHDHLRDLGRQIAGDVSQPSRIWNEDHISIQGERAVIRGILVWSIYTYQPSLELFMEKIMKRSSLPKLQLLSVKGNEFREEFANLSRDLVWLRWHDFNGPNLPSWLSLANLAVLQFYHSTNLEELWGENVEPPLQLRELIIERTLNTCLRGLPRSIGRLKNLKKIVLDGGYRVSRMKMRRLPEEFCDLESLEFFQLSHFPELSSLPHHFGKLINLRTLKLRNVELTALPASFKQLKALQTLQIEGSDSFMLSSEMLDVLEFMTQLQVLNISHCSQLEESPHLTNQISLRELDLSGTGLREAPNNMGQLTKLQTLEIGSPNLTSLPESLGALACLTRLEISDCDRLECLPEALGRLSNLQSLSIERTPLVEIEFLGIGSPSGCNLNTLKHLSLEYTGVRRISISDDCCPTLQTLILFRNQYLTDIETLPRSVRQIDVRYCPNLKKMRGIGGLLNLKEIDIYSCPELEVVECPAYMNSVGHTVSINKCPKARRCVVVAP